MNIENVKLNDGLVKYIDLYKYINLGGKELLAKVRECLGNDVLVNYELMLENDYVETKKQIVNYLALTMSNNLEVLKLDGILDKTVLNDYLQANLKIIPNKPELIESFNNIKNDAEKFEIINHFMSVNEKLKNFSFSLGILKDFDNNTFIKYDIGNTIKNYNDLIDMVNVYLEEHGYIPEQSESTLDKSCGVSVVSAMDMINTDIRELLLVSEVNINAKIDELKVAIRDININKKVSTAVTTEFNGILNDYKLGTITQEDYEYRINKVLLVIKYYLTTFNNYVHFVTGYIEVLECYVKAMNNINNSMEVIVNTFNKVNN